MLRGLRDTPLQAARTYAVNEGYFRVKSHAGDLYYIYAQLRVETLLFSKDPETEKQLEEWNNYDIYQQEVRASNYLKRFLQLFTVARNRRSSLAVCIVMASQ